MDTVDVMARAMIFDEPDNHPSHPPSHSSLQWHYSPRSPSHSPPTFPRWKSSVDPSSEESTPKGRERHKSEPAFIWPKDVDKRLTLELPALLQETSPLASKLIHFKTPTILQKLTPFKTPAVAYMAEIDSFQDPYSPVWILNRNWLLSRPFKEEKRTLKCKQLLLVSFQDPTPEQEDTVQDIWTVHTSSVCSRSTSFCTYTLVTFKLLKSNTAFLSLGTNNTNQCLA